MIEFTRCNPDANNFNEIIKLKMPSQWKAENIKLKYGIEYWIVENPFLNDGFDLFKEVIRCFPIQKNNSAPHSLQPNPFDTIHVPEWVHKDLCLSVRDFYLQHTNTSIVDPQVHEWGNVYFADICKPIGCWRIPHIDYAHGMVGNLWFTNHNVNDSCTKVYKYHGQIYDLVYDFQVDQTHKMHEEWRSIALEPKKNEAWFNSDDKELERWGFEHLGNIPTYEKTLTMYNANVCHTPYISSNVEFRWSHTFAFSHLMNNNNIFDFFKT